MLVDHHPGHKHVAGWEERAEKVTILQDHYCVPHIEVHKLNPKVCASLCLPPADLDWSLHQTKNIWGLYPVDTGSSGGEVLSHCVTIPIIFWNWR